MKLCYHTAQAAKAERKVTYRTRRDEIGWNDRSALGAILSSRAYRQDSLVHIAVLRAIDADAKCPSLEDCRQALETPHFPLYLGRRSCPPALPLAPRIIDAATCSAALHGTPPPAIDLPGGAELPGNGNTEERWHWDDIWEHAGAAPAPAQRSERRHDAKTMHRAWLFAQRNEHSATIPLPETEEAQ